MELTKDQQEHLKLIRDVLKYIPNNYVLKGGTALLLDYDLNRFSEDIDLDYMVPNTKCNNLKNALQKYCDKNKYVLRIKDDTNSRFKAFITYQENTKALKVEVSMRDDVAENTYHCSNGYNVYELETLANKKLNAYLNRSKFRDVYDINFLLDKNVFDKNQLKEIKNHWTNNLNENILFEMFEEDNILNKMIDFDTFYLTFEENLQNQLSKSQVNKR